ncbi:hypothetical protein JOL79_29110 [Microbispora sp. RL4-1S]|uniref:DUF6286 domain-containing protein n=1 Tax=Microbispora oryzae TaxID=2806554 RepID=A0A941AL63_9ACTN|nr:DUF6286 domain-containing protein [Microbispora oryzae]MBP2707846.1 hypothetical protein [Microbispora oryzae]
MITGGTRSERPEGLFVPMRRPESRGVARAFRPRRAVPAAIASLALLVVGGLTAVHVISALVGRPVRVVPYERAARWASTTAWADGRALALVSAVALIGLLLLAATAFRGRARLVTLRTGDPDLAVGVSRRTLSNVLSAAASRVPGVLRARARVHGRHADIKASTGLRDTTAMRERVRAAVAAELDRLAPARPMSVHVRVDGPA